LPFPVLWLALLALWLLLNESLWPGHVLLGGAIAWLACHFYARLQAPPARPPGAGLLRRTTTALQLLAIVAADVLRSNIAVARIVLNGRAPGRTDGFLDVPLELRSPAGLATLAIILTATPGSAWVRYDPERGVLTLHMFDLLDEAAWISLIKGRYERRLREIFE